MAKHKKGIISIISIWIILTIPILGGVGDQVLRNANKNNSLSVHGKDTAGREALTSIFGETIIGIREGSIGKQFMYGIDEDLAIITETDGGTISVEGVLLTGTTSTSPTSIATIETKEYVRYFPGHDTYCFFTAVFDNPSGSQIQEIGLYDDENGFFLRYQDGEAKFVKRKSGVDTEYDTVTPYDGYNIYKGNIYRINYGYLGFANSTLEVKDPDGGWNIMCNIKYPNTSTDTHIDNTYLPIRGHVDNNGETESIKLQSASVAAGIINGGEYDSTKKYHAYGTEVAIVAAGDIEIVTFRNKATFAGKTNKVAARLSDVILASDLNKVSTLYLEKGATITNSPTYTDVNSASVLEYSTDATITVGTGKLLLPIPIAKADKFINDYYDKEFLLYPGETATFYITTTSTSGDISFANNWFDMF